MPGIEGYLDNDHISWTKKVLRANDYFQVGTAHEVVILSVNEESKLLKLGMRELEESPWDSFEESFTIGSEHDGVIKTKYRSGAIIELSYGLQAFVPNKELVKEDNSAIEEGETLKFRIIDFIKYEHKVMLSHTATFKEPQEERQAIKPTKRAPSHTVKKATLSDLGTLSKLKEKLSGKESSPAEETQEKVEATTTTPQKEEKVVKEKAPKKEAKVETEKVETKQATKKAEKTKAAPKTPKTNKEAKTTPEGDKG